MTALDKAIRGASKQLRLLNLAEESARKYGRGRTPEHVSHAVGIQRAAYRIALRAVSLAREDIAKGRERSAVTP